MKHVFIFVANYRKNLRQYDECRAFCSSTTSFGLYCEQCGKVQNFFESCCGSWLPSYLYFLFAFLVFVLLLPFCGILFLGLLFIRELFVSNSLSSSTWFNDGVNTRGSSTLNALRMFSTWQLYSKQATDQSANFPLSEFICSLTHLANVEFNRLINKSGFSLVSGVGVADFDDMKKITGALNQSVQRSTNSIGWGQWSQCPHCRINRLIH